MMRERVSAAFTSKLPSTISYSYLPSSIEPRESNDKGNRCFQRALRGLKRRITTESHVSARFGIQGRFSNGSSTLAPRVRPASHSDRNSAVRVRLEQAADAPPHGGWIAPEPAPHRTRCECNRACAGSAGESWRRSREDVGILDRT